jgi:hypothetical protein
MAHEKELLFINHQATTRDLEPHGCLLLAWELSGATRHGSVAQSGEITGPKNASCVNAYSQTNTSLPCHSELQNSSREVGRITHQPQIQFHQSKRPLRSFV